MILPIPPTTTLFDASWLQWLFLLWKAVAGDQVSSDNGDASITTSAGSAPILLFNTPLTAARTVTFGFNSKAQTYRVVRTSAATGASTLTVNSTPSRTLAAGQWADFAYNGTWIETGFGNL